MQALYNKLLLTTVTLLPVAAHVGNASRRLGNIYSTSGAIWGLVKRCDMSDRMTHLEHTLSQAKKGPAWTSLHGGHLYPYPTYTDGKWVAETPARPSVTGLLPMACDKRNMCPLGTPHCESTVTPSHVCSSYHDRCFHDRRSPLFAQLLGTMKWTWEPVDGCHFTPVAPIAKWMEWARFIEEDAGPMLWVGDSLMAEFFMAFQQLTSGAPHAAFHRADTLVNSWSLSPMSPAQVQACTASGNSGVSGLPCPPTARTVFWEENGFHQLPNMRWVEALEHAAPTLKRLVIGVGSEWWKQYNYPAATTGCHTPNGVAEAFAPMTSHGHLNSVYEDVWRGCDVFDTKFPIMAANVAQYINSVSAFSGHVIIVTSPPGQKGCEGVSAPNAQPAPGSERIDDIKKAAFWYDSNPNAKLRDGHGGQHYFGKLKVVEHAWRDAFEKHAPRLKFSILNITSVSEARPDARVRDGDCQRFCYPGVPHHWSSMMLRLLEQQIYGLHPSTYTPEVTPRGWGDVVRG